MKIFVDADACPKVIKEVLYKAAIRNGVQLILVANKPLSIPANQLISAVTVSQGADIADDYIVETASPGDLVITADIPLADRIISKKAHAINPRGELYTVDNIKHILSLRDFMQDLRDGNAVSGGPKALHQRDVQQFADSLDRFLTQQRQRP